MTNAPKKKKKKQRCLISASPITRFDCVSIYFVQTTWTSYNRKTCQQSGHASPWPNNARIAICNLYLWFSAKLNFFSHLYPIQKGKTNKALISMEKNKLISNKFGYFWKEKHAKKLLGFVHLKIKQPTELKKQIENCSAYKHLK